MATFFSPNGNPEVWENKPDGYFTEAEWLEANPPEILEVAEITEPQIYVPLETRISALEDFALAQLLGE